MLPVVWTEAADEDLATIIEYVFERDPIAARRLWCVFRTNVTGDFGIVTEDSGPS